MDKETIEVVPSEEGGNGLPPETPSVVPEPVTPPTEVPKEEPVQPTEPELFELPDGRKVEAGEVVEEYKSLLADYTRKSQALAAKDKLPDETPKSPTDNPEWQPQSYAELLKVAEERAIKAIEAKEQAKIDERQAIENQVVQQLETIKKTDPNLNENALFAHATKYGFRDLTVAYQNMKDMAQIVKTAQENAVKNITKRQDPVSNTKGGAPTGGSPDPANFGSAVDYLRSLKT